MKWAKWYFVSVSLNDSIYKTRDRTLILRQATVRLGGYTSADRRGGKAREKALDFMVDISVLALDLQGFYIWVDSNCFLGFYPNI